MSYTAQPTGFLADCIQRIRDYSDEPSDSPKWKTDRLYPLIRRAFARILHDVNGMASGPIVVRYDLNVTHGTQTYYLPGNCGEILRFGWVDPTNGYVIDAVTPDSRLNPGGPGIIFEGNTVRFEPFWQNTETLRVEYVPNGDCQMHVGTCTAANTSTTTVLLNTSPSEGYYDRRPNAYLGCVLRLLAADSASDHPSGYVTFPIQERTISGFDPTTNIATVVVPFDFDPSAMTGKTFTYEIVPALGDRFVQASSLRVAHEIHSMEGRTEKAQLIFKLFTDEMKTVKSEMNNLNARTGNRFHGDVAGSGRFGLSIGWGLY